MIKFSIKEAEDMLPLLLSISQNARREINGYNSQLAFHKGQTKKCEELQEKINLTIQKWSEKMRKLGTNPVAMWKIKIPSEGQDFYWEFPQDQITLQ